MNQPKDIATISAENQVVTLINVFTVDPANQQRLIQLLKNDTAEVMSHLPGFVSSSIHAGLDGKTVVNYAQWKSKPDWEAMIRDPEAKKRISLLHQMANSNPHLYRVESVFGIQPN